MKTKKYSYSKLDSFNNCPKRHKFIYIDRLRKEDESIEAFLGKLIHSCLEWVYNQKIDKGVTYFSLDQIINKFKEYWDERWHSQIRLFQFRKPKNLASFIKHKKMDYFTLGVNSLVGYYSVYGPYFNDNVLKVEERIEFQISGFNFVSILDRIDNQDSGNIKVVDYKTGKRNITEKKLSTDLQMGIYSFAVKSAFPDIDQEDITLSHFYTRNNKEVSIKSSIIDHDALKNKISKNIELIELCEENNDFISKESHLCNWCYFWDECDKKNTNNPSFYLE